MPATYNWKVLDESSERVHSTAWEGEGWYATTRRFPGSEIYETWKIPDSWGDMRDIRQRDKVERSIGSNIQYRKEKPQE